MQQPEPADHRIKACIIERQVFRVTLAKLGARGFLGSQRHHGRREVYDYRFSAARRCGSSAVYRAARHVQQVLTGTHRRGLQKITDALRRHLAHKFIVAQCLMSPSGTTATFSPERF
jgi:hypothetical protein